MPALIKAGSHTNIYRKYPQPSIFARVFQLERQRQKELPQQKSAKGAEGVGEYQRLIGIDPAQSPQQNEVGDDHYLPWNHEGGKDILRTTYRVQESGGVQRHS